MRIGEVPADGERSPLDRADDGDVMVRPMKRAMILLVVVACREPSRGGVADAAPSPSAVAPAVVGAPGIPPLAADWIERLELPDHGLAFVTPPVGAREPRPIVVAVHGAVDDPGLICSAWRLIADEYPFVVCPAGTPLGAPGEGRKYVWGSGEQIERRVREALDAVIARYPDHVAKDAPIVYAAFSQGANMAGRLLASDAKRFPRAVFTEGGNRVFADASVARSYARAGGERVLFTCSQPGCAGAFATSRTKLEASGVLARVEYSGPHGHAMPPPVRASIRAVLPWIVAGLEAWDGYADRNLSKVDAGR
jgi:hypothetical protein